MHKTPESVSNQPNFLQRSRQTFERFGAATLIATSVLTSPSASVEVASISVEGAHLTDPNERSVYEAYESLEAGSDLFITRVTSIEGDEQRRIYPGYFEPVPALRLTIDSTETELAQAHREAFLTAEGDEVELVWQHTVRMDNDFLDDEGNVITSMASWPLPETAVENNFFSPTEEVHINHEQGEAFGFIVPLGVPGVREMQISETIHAVPRGIVNAEGQMYPQKQYENILATVTIDVGENGSVDITESSLDEPRD